MGATAHAPPTAWLEDAVSGASILAAGAVWLFGSGWPDILVGSLLALLFLQSAIRVFRAAWGTLKPAAGMPQTG